ncbi:hypothetical protein UFOVP26_48 [uncultured Caudovirales phage]|uniref:Uncharacterized protein n=1 Tax=uncultured Caudovirales phage TaxID=2100421 RepID=A0A6J5KN61_9CAUD|nr:hypothetical protein UFOVP26_48 [uncultured Caudovirales phage]CAB4123758.1 hypothetical protein UFOVP44_49 [uncultured Caudovirales phage]CAB5219166.1 hypothetical protein UFOVP220_40 [uncultured Caudovirales phage]
MAASRKTYVMIAERVKQARPSNEQQLEAYKRAVEQVAQALLQDNSLFHTSRFLEACGLQ